MREILRAALVAAKPAFLAAPLVLSAHFANAAALFDFNSASYTTTGDITATRAIQNIAQVVKDNKYFDINQSSIPAGTYSATVLPFSTTSPVLTNTAGYSGPNYYGGFSIQSTIDASSSVTPINTQPGRSLGVRNRTDYDGIALQNADTHVSNANGWVLGNDFFVTEVILFNQADFNPGFKTGPLSITGIGFGKTPSGTATSANRFSQRNFVRSELRWVVQDSGTLYVSDNGYTAGTSDPFTNVTTAGGAYVLNNNNGKNIPSLSANGSTFAGIRWAPLTISGANFQVPDSGYSVQTFNNVTGVGIWAQAAFVGPSFSDNVGVGGLFNLELGDLHVEGAVVPEPTSLALLPTTALLALRRNRR
jgi:hypothetical protein